MKRLWENVRLQWEERRNVAFRDELKRELAMAASSLPAALPVGAEEHLWERIAGRREWELSVGGARRVTRRTPLAGWLGAATLAMGLVLGVWVLNPPTLEQPVYDGIKGGAAAPARLVGLRYATVTEAGDLRPGGEVSEIKIGTPIVFSVEAEGVDPKVGHAVTLEYMTDARPEREQIAAYQLRSDREILRDGSRTVAFTPESAGTYVFILSSRDQGDGHADGVSFSVQVVEP